MSVTTTATVTEGGLASSNPLLPPGHMSIDSQTTRFRGTQREYSSKPLKHSIDKRILVLKR